MLDDEDDFVNEGDVEHLLEEIGEGLELVVEIGDGGGGGRRHELGDTSANGNQGDAALEEQPGSSSRPSSSCPQCARPGRVDPNQMRSAGILATPHSTVRLSSTIRFSCPCGAMWLCDASQAHEQGEWLQRAGLSGLLSPPADEGLVFPPPHTPGSRRGRQTRKGRKTRNAPPPG